MMVNVPPETLDLWHRWRAAIDTKEGALACGDAGEAQRADRQLRAMEPDLRHAIRSLPMPYVRDDALVLRESRRITSESSRSVELSSYGGLYVLDDHDRLEVDHWHRVLLGAWPGQTG